jgi:hypothetical protein
MLSFPRAAVRAFRAVVHKGIAGRAREPAPPLVLIPERDAVTMLAHLPSIVIAYRVPTEQAGSVSMIVPMAAFSAVAGAGQELISIEPKSKLRAELRWNDRGQPRTQVLELERFTTAHERPSEPSTLLPVASEFLDAMHEAGRTTGNANDRYAFDRIQLKGRSGEVIATDGKQAYLHGGFRLPYKEELLVPALPIFGSVELRKETEIAVGRTTTHCVVRIGPWTLFLVLDTLGRFPDVAAVIPKPASTTILELDEADALELFAALPKLPGAKDKQQPITLDLVAGQHAVVRARAEDTSKVAELILARSDVSKESLRIALDRSFLERAIRLGCRTFQAISSERPVVATNGSLTLITGPLDPSMIAEPCGETLHKPTRALAIAAAPAAESNPPVSLAPVNIPSEPLAPMQTPLAVDPLAEAEALGEIFVEAGQRLAKLVGWLNARRREPRALARAWTRLQSLSLRPRGDNS